LVGVWQHVILFIVTTVLEEHAASTFSVTVSRVEQGASYTWKVRNKVTADSCAALPDRNTFQQDRDASTVLALALEHILNLVKIKPTRMRHVGQVPNEKDI